MTEVRYLGIPEWPGYRVGDDGTVWTSKLGANGGWRRMKTPANKQTGYPRVTLSHENVQKEFAVHILVLTVFVGPCPEGKLCRHLDGNRTTARLSNLAWGSATENEADKARHGTKLAGASGPGAKLVDTDVTELRGRFAAGETIASLSRRFNIHKSTVVRAIYGQTFAELPLPDYSQRPKYHRTWKPANARRREREASP